MSNSETDSVEEQCLQLSNSSRQNQRSDDSTDEDEPNPVAAQVAVGPVIHSCVGRTVLVSRLGRETTGFKLLLFKEDTPMKKQNFQSSTILIPEYCSLEELNEFGFDQTNATQTAQARGSIQISADVKLQLVEGTGQLSLSRERQQTATSVSLVWSLSLLRLRIERAHHKIRDCISDYVVLRINQLLDMEDGPPPSSFLADVGSHYIAAATLGGQLVITFTLRDESTTTTGDVQIQLNHILAGGALEAGVLSQLRSDVRDLTVTAHGGNVALISTSPNFENLSHEAAAWRASVPSSPTTIFEKTEFERINLFFPVTAPTAGDTSGLGIQALSSLQRAVRRQRTENFIAELERELNPPPPPRSCSLL